MKKATIVRFRSAITGMFVTAQFAMRHPLTTIRHTMRRRRARKRGSQD